MSRALGIITMVTILTMNAGSALAASRECDAHFANAPELSLITVYEASLANKIASMLTSQGYPTDASGVDVQLVFDPGINHVELNPENESENIWVGAEIVVQGIKTKTGNSLGLYSPRGGGLLSLTIVGARSVAAATQSNPSDQCAYSYQISPVVSQLVILDAVTGNTVLSDGSFRCFLSDLISSASSSSH